MRNLSVAVLVCLLLTASFSCSKSGKDKPVEPASTLIYFSFRTVQNPQLPQDIDARIIGDTIYAVTFSGTDISSLKPDFAYVGKGLEVNGSQQLSQQSPQNFTSPITYTLTAADGSIKKFVVSFSDTHIPALYINTNNVAIADKETYVPGYMQIKGGLAGDSIYGGSMGIRGRGNSTWGMPKKPYKIKLDKKAGLAGMHESKQWVLLANYADKSLLRNDVAFELSRRAGLAYTPSSRFIDVILNGAYIGNYSLVDQVDVDASKVNISKQADFASTLPEISGGYLFEVDGFANTEAVYFYTPKGMGLSVHYPDDDVISDQQKDFISNHVTKFEAALFATNFTDPVNGYQAYFDLDSYVNWYIVNEVIANPDIFWSTYMYKDRGSDKLFTGPVWDLDIAANNDERLGDVVNKLMTDAAHEPKTWIHRLMEDPAFRQAVRKRWNELKADQLASIPAYVDQLARQLEASQKQNFQTWEILNQKVYLNLQVAGSYSGEVNYLKTFLTNHIAWLDTEFNSSRFD